MAGSKLTGATGARHSQAEKRRGSRGGRPISADDNEYSTVAIHWVAGEGRAANTRATEPGCQGHGAKGADAEDRSRTGEREQGERAIWSEERGNMCQSGREERSAGSTRATEPGSDTVCSCVIPTRTDSTFLLLLQP